MPGGPPPLMRRTSSVLDRGIASSVDALRKMTENMDVPDDDGKLHKSTYEQTRLATKKFLTFSVLGQLYGQILLGISVLSCLQFIAQTYMKIGLGHDDQILSVFAKLELGIASLFLMDWSLQIFVAEHTVEYATRYVKITHNYHVN